MLLAKIEEVADINPPLPYKIDLDEAVAFLPTAVEPAVVEFVRMWLSFLQKALEDAAPESAQKNINLAMLRGLDVPAPPISMLKEFHQRVRQIRALKAMQLKSREACEELFLSLQQKFFAGELAHAG